jgi:multicomponent Na+:H+ antiporter subunit F
MISALAILAGALLTVAAALALIRVVRGPTVLNRIVALDVLVSILLSVLGLEAAYNRHATTLPIMVSLALIGFVGSVSVARFVAADRDDPSPEDEADIPSTLGVDS